MAKKAAVRERKKADFSQFSELMNELTRKVIELQDKCDDDGLKTSAWFSSLAKIAIRLKNVLPSEHAEKAKSLDDLAEKTSDVVSVNPAELSRPIQQAWKAIVDVSGPNLKAAESVFDELRKLVYPESSETQRRGSATKVTVQEFDRVPKLTDEEFEEIAMPMEWGKSMHSAADSHVFEALIDLSSQQVLRYLEYKGYGVRQLSDLTGVTRSTLSAIRNGRTVPQESIAKRILKFAISAE